MQPSLIVLLSITTILAAVNPTPLRAQTVSTQAPSPVTTPLTPSQPSTEDLSTIPRAVPLPSDVRPDRAILESDTQSKHDSTYILSGDVLITYQDHTLRADSITYNSDTGDAVATGHVRLAGGDNDEEIQASHANYNIRSGQGSFYDVVGSVGLHTSKAPSTKRSGYVTPNPFLFQGRLVVKNGPANYVVYDGSVTSCLLDHPDWILTSHKFTLADGQAHASNSTFKLLGIPILFLPYVTHPTNTSDRQSGLLIPVLGDSSSKGIILGEQIYFTLGRSMDATIGTIYYSARGFSESGTFRYRGLANDFLNAHFSALQDRGYTPTGGIYTNQGGEDVTVSFRRRISTFARAVGDAEYLSSYVYREAFTENFNQAVSSDILSTLYVTHQNNGFSLDARVDRYQGLKVVPIGTLPGEQVKIFHAPSLDLTAIDHRIPHTPLLWSLNTSAAGLKRIQPNFVSSGIIERFDLSPELSLPLSFQGWHVFSSIGLHETIYSRSRRAPYGPNAVPVELTDSLNRAAFDLSVDIRPPVLERTFAVPARLQRFLGDQIRHTIEPEITYRNVSGISNFLSVLRFDDVDLLSNTDQLTYGVTQHLYFHPRPTKPEPSAPGCPNAPSAILTGVATTTEATEAAEVPAGDVFNPNPHDSTDANGIPNADASAPDEPTRTHPRKSDPCARPAATPAQKEWFSWKLYQAHFYDETFGNAVINRRRNLFDSTLALSGIAFLTEPRSTSPLISRARLRTSGHTDIEYDLDYDTGASKFTSQNVLLDSHVRQVFGGVSYARLNAPGRFYTQSIANNTLTGSATSNFSQLRFLLGYGSPTRPGLSVATNAGLDLSLGTVQYGAIQSSYNWNCCGLSVEYRKFELGSVRNENVYRFNFTLANIGTAGNLRRAEQIF
jgi:LPS-assembly protein